MLYSYGLSIGFGRGPAEVVETASEVTVSVEIIVADGVGIGVVDGCSSSPSLLSSTSFAIDDGRGEMLAEGNTAIRGVGKEEPV